MPGVQHTLTVLLLAHLGLAAAQGGLPPKFPSKSGEFMDDIIARRVTAADALMAELEEELDRAAKVAEDLAKQKPWTPPFVPPGGLNGGGEDFVNLNVPAVTPTRRVNVDAVGAR
jgi:hypothetical protein